MTCYSPDFIERNGTFILSCVAAMAGCVSGVLVYFLKSRCTLIRGCGLECQRSVLELGPDAIHVRSNSNEEV